jgi:hypothetical protein
MLKAAEILRQEAGGTTIHCWSHTLQLDMIPILEHNLPGFITKIRAIVNTFSRSTKLQDELEAVQKNLKMQEYLSIYLFFFFLYSFFLKYIL